MSQFFTSDGQIIGVSASASVFPMNIQDWFTLGFTDLISLLSKGLSRVFSNTTVQKHQFFNTQLSLWSNSHIHSWLLEKPKLLTIQAFVGKVMSLLFNMLSASYMIHYKWCISQGSARETGPVWYGSVVKEEIFLHHSRFSWLVYEWNWHKTN